MERLSPLVRAIAVNTLVEFSAAEADAHYSVVERLVGHSAAEASAVHGVVEAAVALSGAVGAVDSSAAVAPTAPAVDLGPRPNLGGPKRGKRAIPTKNKMKRTKQIRGSACSWNLTSMTAP